jgi:hypothetical protein
MDGQDRQDRELKILDLKFPISNLQSCILILSILSIHVNSVPGQEACRQ